MTWTPQDGGGASIFAVSRRHGVWQVLRDGVFYGDFPVRQSAMDAVQRASLLPPTRGPAADVRVCEDDL